MSYIYDDVCHAAGIAVRSKHRSIARAIRRIRTYRSAYALLLSISMQRKLACVMLCNTLC